MINLDPSIIDQDSVRKKRRKKLLTIAIAPVVLLFAASLFFMRQGFFDLLFGINFKNESADIAITLSQMQKVGNIVEPYIAYYNAGTAYLKGGDGHLAEVELRESIKNLPPSDKICKVRVNLSYSLEIQADEAKIKKEYDQALVLYNTAEGVLYEDGCANKANQGGKDQSAEKAKQRISKKRNSTVSEMNGNGDGESGNNGEDGLEISEEQLKTLQENAKSGNDVLQEARDRNSSYGGGGAYGKYTVHW